MIRILMIVIFAMLVRWVIAAMLKRKCPKCREHISKHASICPRCRTPIAPLGSLYKRVYRKVRRFAAGRLAVIDRYTPIAIAVCLLIAFAVKLAAPGFYMDDMTEHYKEMNGPVVLAEDHKAYGNALLPWIDIYRPEIDSVLPNWFLRFFTNSRVAGSADATFNLDNMVASLTDEHYVYRRGGRFLFSVNSLPLPDYIAPSLMKKIEAQDSMLTSTRAGRNMVKYMTGNMLRLEVDQNSSDWDVYASTDVLYTTPVGEEGLVLRRYMYGAHAAMAAEEADYVCSGNAALRSRAKAYLTRYHFPIPHCVDREAVGYNILPTFSDMLKKDPSLAVSLWSGASHKFSWYAFYATLFLLYPVAKVILWLVRRKAAIRTVQEA